MTSVEQVGDARSELRRLNKSKDKSAEWVTGLEDEATMAIYNARIDASRKRMMRKQAKRVARGLGGEGGTEVPDVDVSSDDDDTNGGQAGHLAPTRLDKIGQFLLDGLDSIRGMWLFWPCIFLAIASLLAVMQHFLTYQSNQSFNHPSSEVSLWRYGRRDTPTEVILFEYLPFNLFHAMAALATVALCFQLGAATQNFTAFCGVGCGILALVAVVLDGLLAIRACPHGRDATKECNYPFGSHWALTCIKNMGTTVGIACAAYVFDAVHVHLASIKNRDKIEGGERGKKNSRTGTILTAAPAVLYLAFYALTFYYGVADGNTQYVVSATTGKPLADGSDGSATRNPMARSVLYYASLAQAISWILLVPTVHKQRRLMIVATPAEGEGKQKID